MNKQVYSLALTLLVATQIQANVLITEYVEGSGFNKAIEISNFGSESIALRADDYTLSLYSNGRSSPTATLNLAGILVPGSSLVIYNSGLDTSEDFLPPLGVSNNSAINHNGDDALVLKKGNVVIDSIGQVGVDPGSYWGSSSDNTKDHTMRRATSIVTGDTQPEDLYDPTTGEWVFEAKDTLNGLGCSGLDTCSGAEPKPLQEGDESPVDTCIFTTCDEVSAVKDRVDYSEQTYYARANAVLELGVSEFRNALNIDIKNDHVQLSYNQVWMALISTDEDPSDQDNIVLLYTGKSIPKTENASVLNNAPDSWNREHVWAKSHGFPERNQLGYTDLHHLRPADASINSARSNYDFDNGGDPVNDGDLTTENNRVSGVSWEPRNAVKGDVARMMFYMDVRYEKDSDIGMPDLVLVDSVNTDGAEFGKLCTLLQWHYDDAVDAEEIERNHRVYELQGNRNPFIDHPEWATKLYGEQCNGTTPPVDEQPKNRFVDFDYDGDGKADVAVRRPSTFLQYVLNSTDDTIQRIEFGRDESDIPVSGDFDGDGKVDVAVRRSSNQMWYIKNSSDGEIQRINFGKQVEDIPVPADYDGDGITDIAVRRPSNQMWYIKNSSNDEIQRVNFGKRAEDIPVPADYDGDGIADIAVRRPSNQMWYIKNSSDGAIQRINFGQQAGDIPVPADYDGDGKADVAVRRPSTQYWYIKNSSDGEIQRILFGLQEEDIPIPADYDGDGKADVAVRRPTNHYQYMLRSSDGEIQRTQFGRNSRDIPIAAPIGIRMNWFTDGAENVHVMHPELAETVILPYDQFELSYQTEKTNHF